MMRYDTSRYDIAIPGRWRHFVYVDCGAENESVDTADSFSASVPCKCGAEMVLRTIQAMCSCGKPGGHPEWCA